ncbi:MAG: aminotransferase class V-fold PLP-dependent enzyme [bacterium]|nr:aminotransferase class V-fold PLP-dependent enzyme [bacterium]
MKRREFFGKAGFGLAGLAAIDLKLTPPDSNRTSPEFAGTSKTPVEKSLDLESVRKDFPPLQKFNAYLDTAFVGLMPRQIKDAHTAFLDERLEFGPFPNDRSILGVWMNRSEEVRVKLAAFLGAEPDEIAFTYCTGCGSNIAVNGIDWKAGDNAIIDDLQYPTDFHVLNSLKEKGVEIRIARNDNGAVPPEKFEALTDRRTRAIVVSHVSYLNGYRHDLKKLAEIIHARGGYLIVDSAQAIGSFKVDVKEENVDFMSGIPYKWLNGPNGVGFLYTRAEHIPKFAPDRLGWASTNDFRSLETMESNPLPENARRFEYGTLSFEGIYALDAALDYINNIGIGAIEDQNLKLIRLLREELRKMNVDFFTPENNDAPVLSFHIEDERALGREMKENGVYITARRWGKAQARISPHFYNNEEDIHTFIQALSKVLK